MFDVTDVDVEDADALGVQVDNDEVNVGLDAWVTEIVLVTAGVPLVVVNVTVAERADVLVFAAAANVTVPLFEPEAGDTVNQL